MRKLITTLLVVAIVGLSACISHADFISSNPDRFYKQSVTNDGSILYLDKSSIRHYKDNITEYIGIIEVSRTSDLFKEACKLVPSSQEPLYVASAMRIDCVNARFQAGKTLIMGYEKADPSSQIKMLWAEGDDKYSVWQLLKGGGIESGAKAVLCGPSF